CRETREGSNRLAIERERVIVAIIYGRLVNEQHSYPLLADFYRLAHRRIRRIQSVLNGLQVALLEYLLWLCPIHKQGDTLNELLYLCLIEKGKGIPAFARVQDASTGEMCHAV